MMEFHIARAARDRYRFDQSLFQLSGNVVFANFHAARTFAQTMNQSRDLARFPEQAVRAGQINALGLVDEILHYVVVLYRQQRNPQAMAQALDFLDRRLGQDAVDAALRRFCDEFPPLRVYRREQTLDDYLSGATEGIPNREIVLEEMLMLWLANANPATAPFRELFDDAALAATTAYPEIIAGLSAFFAAQPRFGPDNQPLVEMLRSPAIAVPHSLPGQLEYIRTRWGILLGGFLYRLLGSLDLIREEERPIFAGPGPSRVFDYRGLDAEWERYSPDRDWMPRLVLMAKNTYVWLYQLSERYGYPITRLDQVPDAELDTLAEWGFTGLWLIGLWERSRASQRIKQLCGNPEAAASAYSLYDYRIADDLGGEAAFLDLRHRAWQRGIRLASDMVPNHMAIDSRWVIEHPDYFIGQDYCPFAAYTFNGPDLSCDERVGIFIEDHYYDRSDAAVVFKRLDRWTGSVRYIYHGNDGTSMPWNDTAQLNYLNPEVREAVIQLILDVARRFPIIRFDAAMTLTRRHYQRLWFPEPGSGGDIPSRADHAMTREQFAAAMPTEFWRDVVDRVAQEVPDTLLLAEAFWLMEGYFVRTLGMHRVYNSAFMHMLRDEDNAKYRDAIKKTLEFDPEILKRFVNFMNNPDERTAVDQFGKDDKYFGVCTLLATLPGLPMFGHGQVEGFSEKYGMEYRRAYRHEQPDEWLVERHRREIFPLLRRRHLFAEVANFRLYDFFNVDGTVNEDVIAFSNRHGDERGLVIYHNRFATARGWLRTSAAFIDKSAGRLRQDGLGVALGVQAHPARFTLFRDHVTGLEFIRSSQELCHHGLYVELEAYKRHVFLDWREVQDDETQRYARLAAMLNGRGVPSIEEALTELLLQPVLERFSVLLSPALLRRLCATQVSVEAGVGDAAPAPDANGLWNELEPEVVGLLGAVAAHTHGGGDVNAIAARMRQELMVMLAGHAPHSLNSPPLHAVERGLGGEVLNERGPGSDRPIAMEPWTDLDCATAYAWWLVHRLGETVDAHSYPALSRSWVDEWRLGRHIATALQTAFEVDEGTAWRAVQVVKILTTYQRWYVACRPVSPLPHGGEGESLPPDRVAGGRGGEVEPARLSAQPLLASLFADTDVQQFLHVNRHAGVLWFNRESFQQLLWWLAVAARVGLGADAGLTREQGVAAWGECLAWLERLRCAADESGYQVERLLELAD
jgi:glycosidase